MLIPKGGNDVVMTPPELARQIISILKPTGVILEPCKGQGAFTDAMPGCEWCEIAEGKDFFEYWKRVDWIITNPPFSQWRAFWKHSMELAGNVAFLSTVNHLWLKARIRDMEEAGFGISDIILTDHPEGWPQSGFQIGVIVVMRGYSGDIRFRRIKPVGGDGHKSDCAVHNEPAMPNGPCDCNPLGDGRTVLFDGPNDVYTSTWVKNAGLIEYRKRIEALLKQGVKIDDK